MDKRIYAQAYERSEGGGCEICHSYDRTQCHHIISGSGKRKQCERIESVIFLCFKHHYGKNGIHEDNSILSKKLKIKLQEIYFDMGMTETEVRKLMGGKIY